MSTTSNSDYWVETIVDLLEGENNNTWTYNVPQVHKLSQVSQKARENTQDPSLYVWSPVDGDYTPFSADGDQMNELGTVEIQIWVIGSPDDNTTPDVKAARYAKDVIDILSQYYNDNEANTNWLRIRPQSQNDARAEKIARKTDHYLETVQVELRGLRDTGV